MAYKLLLPKFGMAMERAKVLEWKKETGDYINREEAVLVVENEKLTNEIVSMEAGVLLKKVARVGEEYLVGAILAYIGEKGEIVEEVTTAEGSASADNNTSAEGSAYAKNGAPAEGRAYTKNGAPAENDAQIGPATLSSVVGGSASFTPANDRIGSRIAVTPLAKKLASELGLDYTKIPGTGPGGRIEKDDVLKFAGSPK